jgi:Na+/alanine symporter
MVQKGLLAGLLLLAVVVPAQAFGRVYVIPLLDMGNTPRYRPAAISIFKNALDLKAMEWGTWTTKAASGHGVAVVFRCTDTLHCTQRQAHARVKLSRPISCGHVRVFSRLQVFWPCAVPAGATRKPMDITPVVGC